MESKTPKLLQKPKKVKCFKCLVSFEVNFNRVSGEYAQKNNWGYWTEKKKDLDKEICNTCLINLYKKEKWEYLKNITNLKKRSLLRTYLRNGTIS